MLHFLSEEVCYKKKIKEELTLLFLNYQINQVINPGYVNLVLRIAKF